MLVLLAARVEPNRRAAAATITWLMMIASFAITAGTVGALLDPFSFTRLVVITSVVSGLALALTIAATWGLEGSTPADPGARSPVTGPATGEAGLAKGSFMSALHAVMSEPHTRRFTVFVFISMLAYSAQDLILEPFAGAVFGLTPGQSTQLGGLQHSGALLGMILVALIGTRQGHGRIGVLRACLFAGCLGSAGLLASLALAALLGPPWPMYPNVFALGFANGVFAIAAIGSMMGLVSAGGAKRDGMRMGVWGAAQAVAFGLGGIAGTLAVDICRWIFESVSLAYALVFVAQAALFAWSARLAMQIETPAPASDPAPANIQSDLRLPSVTPSTSRP
jgi:BCD family chlorophyll transporter-like MFS transporter